MKKSLLALTLSLSVCSPFIAQAEPFLPKEVTGASKSTIDPTKGVFGCSPQQLVVSIPNANETKGVEICHQTGNIYTLKYGIINKLEVNTEFTAMKTGGYLGPGERKNSKVFFATSPNMRYIVTVNKNISWLNVEYLNEGKYEKMEMLRLVNKLNKVEWGYQDKFVQSADMSKTYKLAKDAK